jgi:hypothetical protein
MKERQGNVRETHAGDQGQRKRFRTCARDNLQEIREHDRELEHVQEKMCRITGNMKER